MWAIGRGRPLIASWAASLLAVASVGAGAGATFAAENEVEDQAAEESPPAEDEPKLIALAKAEAARKQRPVRFDPAWLEPFFRSGTLHRGAESFRQESWAKAETALLKGSAGLPARSPERQAARYLAALSRANQGKWLPAASLFEELHRTYPKLAPYHAYHAARCWLRAGQAQTALDWADRVPSGSIPEAESQLVAIEALRLLDRPRDVAARAGAYVKRFKNGPRLAEALFRQAEALERLRPRPSGAELAEVGAIYRRIWAEAPLESWSSRANERIEALASSNPKAEPDLRKAAASDWLTRGMVYFDRNRNAESEAAFTSVLGAPGLTPAISCKAKYHRAQSIWKQRQRSRAAPLFDEAEAACAQAGDRDLRAKALYQSARCWAASGDRPGAASRFGKVELEHADHSYADDARLRAAEIARDSGDTELAAKLLEEVPAKYPSGDTLNEALWRLAFAGWQAGDDDRALKWLDENLRLIPREQVWYAEGRALYWKARVLERKGDAAGARTYYERAIREYPLSVYALLAMTRVSVSAPKVARSLTRTLRDGGNPPPWRFTPRPLFGDPGFLRAVELARMGQGADARRELSRLGLATVGSKHKANRDDAGADDAEDLLWITAVLLDRGRIWNASHSIPRYTTTRYRLQYPRALGLAKWRLSYPRAFGDLVAKNARANRIPEALQLAIMREESAFSPRIESFANAVGLTQMLVKTARRFSNGAEVSRESLMDPARNLEYGSRFLAFLWNRFGKSAPLAIAGYNAGEGAVDRWLADRGSMSMDEFMETIPYDETRNYTKRVLASYFTYTWLYDDKQPVPGLPLAARSDAGNGAKARPARTVEKPAAASRATAGLRTPAGE